MKPRTFAWAAGIVLILLGIMGFLPPLVTEESDPLRTLAGVGDPRILGLFPTSAALNIIHLALGLWGAWAGRDLNTALNYARLTSVILAALFLFGLVPGPDNLFGLAPLWGNNLLLHGGLALVAALFGWLYRRPPPHLSGRALDPDF